MCCYTKCTEKHGQQKYTHYNQFLRIERTVIYTSQQNSPQGQLIQAAGAPGVFKLEIRLFCRVTLINF